MAHARYDQGTARVIARRIWDKYRDLIAAAAHEYDVPAHWLAGLTGMENPQCYEWPDERSVRFEAAVYARFAAVLSFSPRNWATWSYNGVRYKDLKGTSDAALRALSTSYGQTQIMGYYILTILAPAKLRDLRDPRQHYNFTGLMLRDPFVAQFVRQGRFDQVCHIWNSGRIWNGRADGLKTHSPYYLANCQLVADAYERLVRTNPGGPAQNPYLPEARRQFLSETLASGATEASFNPARSNPGIPRPGEPVETLFAEAPLSPVTDPRHVTDEDLGRQLSPVPDPPPAEPEQRAAANHDLLLNEGYITPEQHPEARQVGQEDNQMRRPGDDLIPGWETRAEAAESEAPAEVSTRPPGLNKVSVRPGWRTSQGQLTGLFVAVAALLSLLGWKFSPAQVQGLYEALVTLGTILGPIVALVPVLINYINSRGKIQSNSLWATASMNQGIGREAAAGHDRNRVPILEQVYAGPHQAAHDLYSNEQIDEAFGRVMSDLAAMQRQLDVMAQSKGR